MTTSFANHFDETFYLSCYPDVAAGSFKSGYDHFVRYGRLEGRQGSPHVEIPAFSLLPSDGEFYESIIVNSLHAIKANRYSDNFDKQRFNLDGSDHSAEFDPGRRALYFDWFFRNYERLYLAYSHLDNEVSKRLFLFLIAYRLGGHLSVRLPVPFATKTTEYEAYKRLEIAQPSIIELNGMFGKLNHYDFKFREHRYTIDGVGLEYYLFRRQYFYSSDGITIGAEHGDIVIDGGAWLGDTALVFSNAVGVNGKVYAFEPVADHLAVLKYNVSQFPIENVICMPYGLSDANVSADPVVLTRYDPGFSLENEQQIPLCSIDHLINSGTIDKIDFIKLDVEGAELPALRGARESIRNFKPKLAISLYHRPNDLFEIIIFIKEKFPFYGCYIDHYTIHQEETVLYCANLE